MSGVDRCYECPKPAAAGIQRCHVHAELDLKRHGVRVRAGMPDKARDERAGVTNHHYAAVQQRFFAWLLPVRPEQATPQDVSGWIGSLPVSVATARVYRSAINAWYAEQGAPSPAIAPHRLNRYRRSVAAA